jgi:hypothetical protein
MNTDAYGSPPPSLEFQSFLDRNTMCGRKAMQLAMLCTNRQGCWLPLHVAVRLTPAVESAQV